MSYSKASLASLFLCGAASLGCSFAPSNSAQSSNDGGNLSADAASGLADASSSETDGAVPDASVDSSNEPEPGELQSHFTAQAPLLDTVKEDLWNTAPSIGFAIGDSAQLETVQNYVESVSIAVQSLYDASNIYFYMTVSDDSLLSDSADLWNDDSVELYLDGANDRLGPFANDDHFIVIRFDDLYTSLGPAAVEIEGTAATTNGGYAIEISIARTDLGMPANATTLGFNLGLNDDDGIGNSQVDAYGLWFLPQTEQCDDCCASESTNYAWCDTTRLGQLILAP